MHENQRAARASGHEEGPRDRLADAWRGHEDAGVMRDECLDGLLLHLGERPREAVRDRCAHRGLGTGSRSGPPLHPERHTRA